MDNNRVAQVIIASSFMTVLGTASSVNATPNPLLVQETETTTYDEFRSFLKDAVGNPNYRVSYQMEVPNQPKGTVQQWFKGEKFRIDTEVEGTNARIYRVDDSTTTCMNREGNWNCFNLPEMANRSAGGSEAIKKLREVEENSESYQNRITKAGTRVVAGEETTCFEIEESEENESWLSCYSNNHGIPLYMEGENSEGSWQMTATDFQTSVSEEDFKLPAEPQSMPNMPR